jgi:hypothetical protein
VYILPEDGHRSGPKHVVVVHNKIEHEKHLLRTVVLFKVLVDTRATGCITQQLRNILHISYLTNPIFALHKSMATKSTKPQNAKRGSRDTLTAYPT